MSTTETDIAEVPLAPYQEISLVQRFILGIGGITDVGMQSALVQMASPIFNVFLKVDPVTIGIALSLPRFMEIIIDPWIGGLSDRTQGHWGRRHPYMFWGGVACGAIFSLIWCVPLGWSVAAKGWWLIAFALLQFAAYSLFIVPYSALLAEVSSDPVERTRIFATKTAYTTIAGLLMGWFYYVCMWKGFSNPLEGMRFVGIAFGVLMTVCAILPIFVCKKSRNFHSQEDQRLKKENQWQVVWEILQINEFRGVLLSLFCLVAAFTLVSNLGFYINLYFLFAGNAEKTSVFQGICSVAGCSVGILSCYIVSALTKRFGTWPTLTTLMIIEVFAHISLWWTAEPQWPYLSLASALTYNLGLTAFWIFMPAFTGEITNHYEQKTGKSLYGSFSAISGIAGKIATSCAMLFSGYILNMTGFKISLGDHQYPLTLTYMRVYNSLIPALGVVLALVFLLYIKSTMDTKGRIAGNAAAGTTPL